ncbi:BlaI/MecI/CopY family transcriptional regulator [Streptomyces sp. NRRL S-813]|uniref:BlaI/MecI/CopY family transcriptional regulator n=1 Tax=Streptomyces sp. NRRL S-813 TaxID=1463919 RepID=UPI00055EE2CB|nr:BlaI/MecI/CopY family transcriptional regulator [Streptomyces sp. NRRL S-813]
MPENTTAASELTSQYSAQVTNDLEHNVKDQERINAEISALQEQLTTLQHDHAVLLSVQQALGAAPALARSVLTPTEPARRKEAASGTTKTTRPKRITAVPVRRKPASRQAVTTRREQPKLVDLVREHLAKQNEPRSAGEVTTALGQAHPERRIKTTVVRTTLEALVAKGQVKRTRQGRSVFYITGDAPEQASQLQRLSETHPDHDE